MAQATHRLTGVDVRYISLAGRPKNGRAMVLKAGTGEVVVERETRIVKADAARQMAYGVVYAPDDVDADGHTMSAGEIEKAMLGFMAKGRVGAVDVDHDEQTGGAYVAESWLVKSAGGQTVDATFPGEAEGTWVVGIKVDDAATWGRIEAGDITGLSFAGVAAVEVIADAADVDVSDSGAELRKSFGTALLRSRLWETTSALGEALRAAMDQTETPVAAAVGGVIGEYRTWLLGHLGDAAEPAAKTADDIVGDAATGEPGSAVETQKAGGKARAHTPFPFERAATPTDPGSESGAGSGLTLDEIRTVVQDAVAPLATRIEAIEDQTGGRQSAVGDVAKAERTKGLRIV